jgi:hypothetical protein
VYTGADDHFDLTWAVDETAERSELNSEGGGRDPAADTG